MSGADRVKFPEEKLAELQQLISDGVEAEKILRSPLWGRIFASMRETYVQQITAASYDDESTILCVKIKLEVVQDLDRVLKALFTKARAASKTPEETPVRDVTPRERVQR